MSFMFNPLPYDDMRAVNRLSDEKIAAEKILAGNEAVFSALAETLGRNSDEGKLVVLDGYLGADFNHFAAGLQKALAGADSQLNFFDIRDVLKPEAEIEKLVEHCLPLNYEDDPVLLFGKLYEGAFTDFIERSKLASLLKRIQAMGGVNVIFGLGSANALIREAADLVIYIDITPKEAVLRVAGGEYRNIGAQADHPFEAMMRRFYYVDIQVAMKLRRELIEENKLDFYVIGNKRDQLACLGNEELNSIFDELARRPFRAKPVYLEGVWGGEFIRKARNLPVDIAPKIAWVFELIPLEVSIAVDIDGKYLDFPFYTFVNARGRTILGDRPYEDYNGYYPIRFNYDDTWHSNGNMSIQVHPGRDFAKENYRELGSQDEAYYIVATGHDARTYCGFKGDGREFLELCKAAEKNGDSIDYQKYISSEQSIPGKQFMIPAGTVHASGRNQLVLELGSLTVGSYTYKIYDYNRKDINGKLRPIHTNKAEKVLGFERDTQWVRENLILKPEKIKETAEFAEYVIGRNDRMYYQTHRINLETGGKYEGATDGEFTVLSVVDGEEVVIRSKANPELQYRARFLDVITVPASITEYVVEAKGYQPVVIHKTILRKGDVNEKNS
ncbi:MAG: hypothetical protein FH749_15960 [Firmicutes bacterium]|nr:hypothetical protein [Bacillota bacterium]